MLCQPCVVRTLHAARAQRSGGNGLGPGAAERRHTWRGLDALESRILLSGEVVPAAIAGNHAPVLRSIASFRTAIDTLPYAMAYDQLLAHAAVSDRDGDAITFQIDALGRGEFALNGAAAPATPFVISSGDVLTWTPPAGLHGDIKAFSIQAFDGTALSTKTVSVVVKTALFPTVSIRAPSQPARETSNGSGARSFRVSRSGGDKSQPLTVTYNVAGSATPGADYETLPGMVTLPAGRSSAVIRVAPVNDPLAEDTETIDLQLTGGDVYQVNPARAAASLLLKDNAPKVWVVASRKSAVKTYRISSNRMGEFTIKRTGSTALPLTVPYLMSGTADNGGDYQLLTGSAVIPARRSSVRVKVVPLDNGQGTAQKSTVLTLLANDGPTYHLSTTKAAATVTLNFRLEAGVTPPDAGGWTVVTPVAEDQIIYVSSSTGSDSNDGLTADSPVQTIAHAEALFTTGRPAWLLLKAGDTWNEAIGQWLWPGLSADKPSLIGSYGTGPRPVLKTGSEVHGLYLGGGGNAPATLSFIDVIGINFYANGRDPNSPDFNLDATAHPVGFLELLPGQNILIEDCAFQFYESNVVIQGSDPVGGANRVSDVTLRRCVIVDAYGLGTVNSEGIFIHDADGVLIEENVLDHNGWNTQVDQADPTVFNHNMYLTDGNTGVVVRNNISADASSHGIMQRSGGIVAGNLLLNDPISISVGNSYGVPSEATQVTGNVVLDGSDILMRNSVPLAWGIIVDPTNPSTLVQGNLVAHDICPGDNVEAIEVSGNNNTVTGNVIYNWRGGIVDLSQTAVIDPGQVDPPNLADPTRSIASYMIDRGLTGSLEAFLVRARQQSKFNWDSVFTAVAVNAYLRQGFAPALG